MVSTKSRKVMKRICYGMIFLALCIFGCGNDDDDDDDNDNNDAAELPESKLDSAWQIESSEFAEDQEIPKRFTCEGDNVSPALSWSEPPAGTQSIALMMDDPDAPSGTFTHWILYNLPPDQRNLDPEQPTLSAISNAKQGKNDFDKVGYFGPCPPSGSAHRYRFRLFALDTKPDIPPEPSRDAFLNAIEDHVIAEAQLTGIFSR